MNLKELIVNLIFFRTFLLSFLLTQITFASDHAKGFNPPKVQQQLYHLAKLYHFVAAKEFKGILATQLENYRPIFEKIGHKYNVPWTLLATQAYQESRWQSLIEEELEKRAKFLSEVQKSLPKNLEGKNIWALGLVAYKLGKEHFYDAQSLTALHGKNPHLWKDLKEIVPLLHYKYYYKNLRYGYANGFDAIAYVDAIQHYYNLLIEYELAMLTKESSNGAKK